MKIIKINLCYECPHSAQGSTTEGIDQCSELIGLYLKTMNDDDWEKSAIRTGEILPDCPLEDYKD